MRLLLVLGLILCLTLSPALAEDKPLGELMGIQMYTGMLNKHAARGDEWSRLRLHEVNRGLTLAETGRKFEETSWWNLPGKARYGWEAYWQEKSYHDAAAHRRKYEDMMRHYGYGSPGQNAEKWQRLGIQLGAALGISPTAREGQTMIEMVDALAKKSFEFGETNGLLHPIRKITLLGEISADGKKLDAQRRRVEEAAKKDPLVQIGVAIKGIGDIFQGIGGKKSSSGRISQGEISDSLRNLDANRTHLTHQLDREMGDLQRRMAEAGTELNCSLQGLQQSLNQLGRELDGIGRSLQRPAAGPDAVRPATPLQGLEDRLRQGIH